MLGEAREEPVEIMAGELPGKGLCDSLVTLLEGKKSFGQDIEVGEVVGSYDLALHHREVNLDLVEPGSVSRKVDEAQVGPFSLKALHRSLTPMRGAVVHDPEHAIGGGVGLLFHRLLDQPPEGFDAVLRLTTTEKLRPVNIPGGQVGQCSFALVVVFHSHGGIRSGWQGRVAAAAGLDGGLLVGAENVFFCSERLTLPPALVEVQYQRGFMREVGVAGEDPGAMVEGTDSIFRKPSPNGGSRDLGYDAPLNCLPSHLPGTPAAQRDPAAGRKLASQSLQLYPHLGGKRSEVYPSEVCPPVHPTPPRRSACAIYSPSEEWCLDGRRSPYWRVLRRPKGRSWREPPPNRERCERALVRREWHAHRLRARCSRGFGWASLFPSGECEDHLNPSATERIHQRSSVKDYLVVWRTTVRIWSPPRTCWVRSIVISSGSHAPTRSLRSVAARSSAKIPFSRKPHR